MDNIANKIKQLKQEDLEFYQKLISFFEFIGITTDDLVYLVKLIKSFPEFIGKINQVLKDQQVINDKYDAFIKGEVKKEDNSNPLSAFNKEVKRIKPYGDRE
jgi:hypothetical protein